jgi:hypothetical protein
MLAAGADLTNVERACEFVLTQVERRSGHRAFQGKRQPPLVCRSSSRLVRCLAEQRFHRVPVSVARALVAWGDGFPVILLTRVPCAGELLEFQAKGRRCVSLLSDDSESAPHSNVLDFVLHDLCHLDKYADPEHHLGQVGFFAGLRRACARREWCAFDSKFDDAFRRDFAHVSADMNGSSVFLFAALKMKLKMAVRRRCNLEANRCDQVVPGASSRASGPLDEVEEKAYRAAEDELFELLGLDSELVEAGRALSTRRDDPRSALKLLRYFEDQGSRAKEDT